MVPTFLCFFDSEAIWQSVSWMRVDFCIDAAVLIQIILNFTNRFIESANEQYEKRKNIVPMEKIKQLALNYP